MHPKAVDALRSRVAGLVKQTQLDGQFPVHESCREHINALTRHLLKEKSAWLADIDVYSICLRYIAQAVSASEVSSSAGVVPLTSVLSEPAQEALTSGLTDFLVSIPRGYRASLQLPPLSIAGARMEVREGMAVVFPSSETAPQSQSRLRGLLDVMSATDSFTPPTLEVEVQGYAGFGPDTSAARSSITAFKIAMQQLLNRRVVRRRFGLIANAMSGWSNPNAYTVPKHYIHFLDLASDGFQAPNVELSIDICQFIDSHEFSFATEGPEARREELLSALKLVASLLNSSAEGSGRLRAACEWRFDAYLSANPAISLVQTSIGLESLFGEDDEAAGPLTRMLADRCAYLIGPNIAGRRNIRENFTKFYRARSKVVHGNAIALSEEDSQLLRWGQHILDIAIQRELAHVLPRDA